MKEIPKFICLLGLPRSGTTVTTAIIDAHPAVEMFYEPWNSSRKNPPPIYKNPLQFQIEMRKKLGTKPNPETEVVGFKETSEHQESLEWSKLILKQMEKHCECLLLFLVRDPIHAYLSKVEGARKYWNHPNAQVTEEGYKDYTRKVINAYRYIGEIANDYKTIIFDYDAIVESPENILPKIMEFIGLQYEESQLNYYEKKWQKNKIMGDPEVGKNPKKISTASMIKRKEEAEEFRKTFKLDYWEKPEIQALESYCQKIKSEKVTRENIFLPILF